ncbi:MAG: PAS domain-containing protein, partial [Desulfomonilaceae bacterium]
MLDEDKTREQLIYELRQERLALAEARRILRMSPRQETELPTSEQTLRSLIENAPVAIIVTSGVRQNVEIVNRRFTELFGYKIEDIPDIDHWWSLAYSAGNPGEDFTARWNSLVEEAIKNKSHIEGINIDVKPKH